MRSLIRILLRGGRHLEGKHAMRVSPAGIKVYAADTTTLLGPTGCGKTTIALRFVAHGALEGESCLYASFQESPNSCWQKPRGPGGT